MAGQLMLVNPRKKRRRKTTVKRRSTVTVRQARSNPIRRKRRSRSGSRNFNIKSFMNQTVVPAAIGGAGALAVDVAWGVLPIPANLKSGPMAPLIKSLGAIGVGFIGRAVAGKKVGDQVLAGAVTVSLYGLSKMLFQKALPNVPLGEYEDYTALNYINAGQFQPDPLISDVHIPDYEMRSGAGMSEYMGEYQY